LLILVIICDDNNNTNSEFMLDWEKRLVSFAKRCGGAIRGGVSRHRKVVAASAVYVIGY